MPKRHSDGMVALCFGQYQYRVAAVDILGYIPVVILPVDFRHRAVNAICVWINHISFDSALGQASGKLMQQFRAAGCNIGGR